MGNILDSIDSILTAEGVTSDHFRKSKNSNDLDTAIGAIDRLNEDEFQKVVKYVNQLNEKRSDRNPYKLGNGELPTDGF